MKQCLIYTEQEFPANQLPIIQSILKTHNLVAHLFEKRQEIESWTHDHDTSEVSLLIIEGEKTYLEDVLLMLFEQAFIIWIHSHSYEDLRGNERIEVCSSIPKVIKYLKAGLENGIAKQEFKRRVLFQQVDVTYKKTGTPDYFEEQTFDMQIEMPSTLTNQQGPINPEEIEAAMSKLPQKDLEINPEVEEKDLSPAEPQEYLQEKVKEQEEELFRKRSRNLQKQLFTHYTRDDHKMIGVWSPIHQIGVTTFILNFAIFLENNRINTSVLEGITQHYNLKNLLARYTKIPANWVSYAKAIHQDNITKESLWLYRNVKFLPLDFDDMQHKWDEISLDSYMNTTKVVDVTLVDLPTGAMSNCTLDSLKYLDELWIIVKDSYHDVLSWKEYIHLIQKQSNLPFRLIYNQTYPFSQTDRLSKDLAFPLLTQIPSLHEEAAKNNYESVPLYEKEEAATKLEPSFTDLAKYLFGEQFETANKYEPMPKKNWLSKALKRLME
jgi:hypothetical protein